MKAGRRGAPGIVFRVRRRKLRSGCACMGCGPFGSGHFFRADPPDRLLNNQRSNELAGVPNAARGWLHAPMMSTLTNDLRHAARLLLKTRAFTIVAVATLAL